MSKEKTIENILEGLTMTRSKVYYLVGVKEDLLEIIDHQYTLEDAFINYVEAHRLQEFLCSNLKKVEITYENCSDEPTLIQYEDIFKRYDVERGTLVFLIKTSKFESICKKVDSLLCTFSEGKDNDFPPELKKTCKEYNISSLYWSNLKQIIKAKPEIVEKLLSLCKVDKDTVMTENLIKHIESMEQTLLSKIATTGENLSNLEGALKWVQHQLRDIKLSHLVAKRFVTKLVTLNKFKLGSFDVYYKEAAKLILNNNPTIKNVDEELKKYPTSYRMAILNKDNEFVGYISVYDFSGQNFSSSIRLETIEGLSQADEKEILDVYKKWVKESLHLGNIQNQSIVNAAGTREFKSVPTVPNIIVAPAYLKKGMEYKGVEEIKKQYPNSNISKLAQAYTIVDGDRVIGVIGLSDLIWSNRRADLNIYLNQNIEDSIKYDLASRIIEDYLRYLHDLNIYNVSYTTNSNNTKMNDIIGDNMQLYAEIPYSTFVGEKVGSKLLYQHYPGMNNTDGQINPINNTVGESIFRTTKADFTPVITIDDNYRLVRPSTITDENVKENVILGYATSMQNREKFTKPLGEDKYALQIGNNEYGLSKALMKYSYILLDNNNDFCGFINVLRSDENKINAEIEVGIKPELQRCGLGTKVTTALYDELFMLGYASVTSAIFDFNNPSIKMHNKIAGFNGTRIGAYFINGELCDMHYCTAVNSLITNNPNNKTKIKL